MRTTVDIEAPILREVKTVQKREGGTLGATVTKLLAEALAHRPKTPAAQALAWTARPMRASVDLADKDAVYSILDQVDRAAEP